MALLLHRQLSVFPATARIAYLAQSSLTRSVSSNRKKRHQANMEKYNTRTKAKKGEELPLFQSLMRKFFLRAHPDLLLAHSETMSKINDNSMKELNGVLSTVKLPSEYPPAIDKVFVFYLKKDAAYEKFTLHLETSGGDSRKQLKSTFEDFFARTNIHHSPFRWDKEFFPVYTASTLPPPPPPQAEDQY